MHLTVSSCHATCAFQSESTLYTFLNFKELLARNREDIWSLSDCNGTRTHNDLVPKRTLNYLAKLMKLFNWIVSTYLYVPLECMFFSCPYAFQTESTLYICLNFKELLARNKCDTWYLSGCNRTRTYNHLVRKRRLYHLGELNKWLSWVMSTYMYGAFDCIFLSCHVRVSD